MTKTILFTLLLGIAQGSFARQGDSLLNMVVKDPEEKVYYKSWDQKIPIYNGRQFYGYPSIIEGHAFYRTDKWQNGAVKYEGTWYYDLPLLFDLHTGSLVSRAGAGLSYMMVMEKIQGFIIGKDEFVLLGRDSVQRLPSGFYQEINDSGPLKFFIRRSKRLEEKIENNALERRFLDNDVYYVWKNNEYHPVKNQRQLFSIMKDKQKAISQYRRQKGMRFKDNPELFIASMIEYYNKN